MAHPFGSWLPLAAQVTSGILIALAMVVAVRRMAIGLAAPIAISTTLATAVVLLLLVIAIRRAAAGQLPLWLPTTVLACWAVACSYPGSQVMAWIVWGGAMAIDLLVARRPEASIADGPTLHQATAGALSAADDAASREACGLDRQQPADATCDDGEVVLQHVVRVRDPNGNEYVHATLRGEFGPGERRTTLYVGFCPPFAVVPQVEAEVIEGPPGMVKVVQALHNGAQVEVDLDEASLEPAVVTIEVAAYQVEDSGVAG